MTTNLNLLINDTVYQLKDNLDDFDLDTNSEKQMKVKNRSFLKKGLSKQMSCELLSDFNNIAQNSPLKFFQNNRLIPKYKNIGHMNIDFYETFSNLTKIMRGQAGKFFENYSFLYNSNERENEEIFNLKLLKNYEKKFQGDIYDSQGEVIGEVIL